MYTNPAAAQPQPPPPSQPRFLSHEEERTQLGRPLWREIKDRMPRVQHDGTLEMPARGMSVDLKALQRDYMYPRLPYVAPAAAPCCFASGEAAQAVGGWGLDGRAA